MGYINYNRKRKKMRNLEKQIIREKQDLTYLSWAKIRNSSGTAGSFLKSYSELGGKKTYYKLSDYDRVNGIVGHECVNEIIVDRLLDVLEIDHLHYQLIHSQILIDDKEYETYLCASKDFKEAGESKIALEVYYEIEKMKDETPLEFCVRKGWEDYIYQMLVVDFLILNRDRHGANIEVLRNSKKKEVRLAPLFDHGLSLLCRCYTEEEVSRADVLDDKPVQCFVGSRSTKNNLALIPKDKRPCLNVLKEADKEYLFKGLEEIISENLKNRIWEMIWKRWKYYESFCD